MNRKQLYKQLVDAAEKLGISVSEHNFRATGVKARSGLCQIRGKQVFIMDKHLGVSEKIEILAACLRMMETDNVYIVPAVRKLIDR